MRPAPDGAIWLLPTTPLRGNVDAVREMRSAADAFVTALRVADWPPNDESTIAGHVQDVGHLWLHGIRAFDRWTQFWTIVDATWLVRMELLEACRRARGTDEGISRAVHQAAPNSDRVAGADEP